MRGRPERCEEEEESSEEAEENLPEVRERSQAEERWRWLTVKNKMTVLKNLQIFIAQHIS